MSTKPPRKTAGGDAAAPDQSAADANQAQDEAWEAEQSKKAAARVLVIYTGGTIGMVPDSGSKNSPLRPGSATELSKYVRRPIADIWWDLKGLQDTSGKEPKTIGPLDSSSVGPEEWRHMAAAIHNNYEKYDGFVILHGTDTMAFTASALSFMLKNLGKPVILTGSQLPIAEPRTDAVMNFVNALHIAGGVASGLPQITEVAICFGDALLRGNRTTKVSTSRWQGFDTPNYPHLGSIGEHIVIDQRLLREPPKPSDKFDASYRSTKLDHGVATVPIYPGMSGKVLAQFLDLENINGFVLRCFGAGNAPEDPEFLEALSNAVKAGKIIVNTTQCLEGTVEMGLYAASSGLQSAGVITGLDLTPEAALTKLMWLLETDPVAPLEPGASDDDKDRRHKELVRRQPELRLLMQRNVRGEQTGSVVDVEYANQDTARKFYESTMRPPVGFKRDEFKNASLRLEKVEVLGAEPGETVEVYVFINLPNADASMAEDATAQYAGKLSGIYRGDRKTDLFLDVSKTVARVCEDDGSIRIRLVPAKPDALIGMQKMVLSLFNN